MFEVKDLPKRHAQVQKTKTGDGASHPSRSNHVLQGIGSGFPGGVQEEIIVAPIAQAEKPLGDPRKQCKHNADFQAEDYVEDDAKFCGHGDS